MKILVVTPYFYPHKGGSQQYAEELHYHLMQSDPSVSVDVLCYNTDKAKSIEKKYRGFTIYRIPCWQPLKGQFAIPNYLELIKTLRKLHKKNRYDIINSHTRFFESSWWVPFAAKMLKSKSLLTDHCAHHPTHTSSLVNFIAKNVDNYLVPLISRFYDSITVTNKATFEFLTSLGISKPTIIYGGVDTKFYSESKRQKLRNIPKINIKLDEKDLLITFVGRMIHSKGPHLLYDAVKNIISENKNIKVVFAGDGEMLKGLSKNTIKNIYFTGSLDRDDIAKLLSNTDILVHPSLHHEGFPNVLLEAGSAKCAVIATDQGGTKELIENMSTGLLVNPEKKYLEEAIRKLISDSKLRLKLSRSLHKRIKSTYDWKIIIKEYKSLTEHLIK